MNWREHASQLVKDMPPEIKALRKSCLKDLRSFARTMNPGYMYGDIHMSVFKEMMDYDLFGTGDGLTANKLILLPRAHLKSHMVATWAAWVITNHPEVTILYLSATSELAETQLFAIKSIFESSRYQKLFPEYINPLEGKRSLWNNRKISIDHVARQKEAIRDATIATAGLTTNTTGWHADIIIPDDLMVPENAYTEDGRELVRKKSSQFTSIRNPGGFTMACGTRYHPSDIYDSWLHQQYDVFDEESGDLLDTLPVWRIIEHKVEVDDVFLWPKAFRDDGKSYGFDRNVLARIYAEYEDKTQFYAQYYNDPNEVGSNRINRDRFQYFEEKDIEYLDGRWCVRKRPLNVYAAIDFAFARTKKADYTAIVVVGMDAEGFLYVLDIYRFKTNKIKVYFDNILEAHSKWSFKKLRAEISVAQEVIVEDIKDMIRAEGMSLSVDPHRPSRHQGSKEERIAAVIEPRYENLTIWHKKGGWTPALEEEVLLARPKHDDLKDTLASVIEICKPPRKLAGMEDLVPNNVIYNSRFGGVNFRGTR
jgi:phage terminase large subunit-like protein